MGYRKFDTTTWQDAWFENLSGKAKLLFIYLWTNEVCNQAGMYPIAKKRMEYAVGYSIDEPLQELSEKVQWFQEYQVVWVKNFYRHQSQNDSFRQAALSSIQRLPKELIQLFIDYNGLSDNCKSDEPNRNTVPTPTPHHGDMVPSSVTVTVTETVTEEGCISVGGMGGVKQLEPPSASPQAVVVLADDGNTTTSNHPPTKTPNSRAKDLCPHEQLVALYHQLLPELPHVSHWNGDGKKSLAQRWREDRARQSLDWWEAFFLRVAQSDFLTGRKTDWRASLGWLVKPKNLEKVINGHYDNHKAPIDDSGYRPPERLRNNVQAAMDFIRMGGEA